MQRLESNYSEDKSYRPPVRTPKRKQTWTSSFAAEAHEIVMAEYKAESIPEPKAIHNFRTYLIAVIMCMGAAAYGYDTGFFGGTLALDSFKRSFGMTKDLMTSKQVSASKATMISLFQLGSFCGAGMQLPFTERFGRKWSVVLSNVIFIASAFVQTFANGSIAVFCVGRFLGGFAVGFLSLVIPVYLSEFAPPSIRGRLVGFFDIFIQVGTLCGFWINYAIEETLPSNKFQWQLPVFVQFFPAAFLLIGGIFVPESPRWLLMRGRDEEAVKNLVRIRNIPAEHEYLVYELGQTQEQVEAEKALRGDSGLLRIAKELFTVHTHRKRVLLGMSLIFFKTFSGVQAVNYYSPVIFEQLGFVGAKNSLFATGIYGTVKFVCTLIFGFFIVDRVGRRIPLMAGSIGLSLCLFFLGGYLTGVGPKAEGAPRVAGDYVAIAALFLYAAWYCFGWNSVPLTLISEIFGARHRIVSMTVCLMWQWLCTFSIVRIMPIALLNVTTKTYFIFGSIFICAAPFVFFLVPETKGLSLEYVDRLFDKSKRTTGEDQEGPVTDYTLPQEEEKPVLQHLENVAADPRQTLAAVKE